MHVARRQRDYKAEYQARQRRAREQGWRSYYEQRRAFKRAKDEGLPPPVPPRPPVTIPTIGELLAPASDSPEDVLDSLLLSGTLPGRDALAARLMVKYGYSAEDILWYLDLGEQAIWAEVRWYIQHKRDGQS